MSSAFELRRIEYLASYAPGRTTTSYAPWRV
jgi:hypothetical protein